MKMLKNEAGGGIVEFALVVPLFLLVVMTILELGIMLVMLTGLQIGLLKGTRDGVLGETPNAITASIQAANFGMMTPSNITVTIQSYALSSAISGSNAAAIGTPVAGSSGVGTTGQMVLCTATYSYTPISPLVSGIFGRVVSLSSYSMFKNN